MTLRTGLSSLAKASMLVFFSLSANSESNQQQQLEVSQSSYISADPAVVWEVVSDFYSMDKWHPTVFEVKEIGTDNKLQRILTVTSKNGPQITEELVSINPEDMTLSYKIIDMSTIKTIDYNGTKIDLKTLPVEYYISTIKVEEGKNNDALVTWSAKFDEPQIPAEAGIEGVDQNSSTEAIKWIYRAGLEGLKRFVK